MNRGVNSDSPVLNKILRGKKLDRPVLLVVAHPDDESVGAASRLALMPEAHILLMTDGAPVDPLSQDRENPERLAYRAQRQREFRGAMRLVGLHSSFSNLDLIDQQAHLHLPQLVEHCLWLLQALSPALVLTHPYEGGHPDHDSAAFVVATAMQLLARSRSKGSGQPLPEVAEMAFYSRVQRGGSSARGRVPKTSTKSSSNGNTHPSSRGGGSPSKRGSTTPAQDDEMLVGEFRHGSAGIPLNLSDPEQALRSALLESYPSQQAILSLFSRKIERFRPAPDYDFSLPPHSGRLLYEGKGWGDFEDWHRAVLDYLRESELAMPAPLRGQK